MPMDVDSVDLVVVGAGGFGRETAAAVRAVNAVHPSYRLLGFLDDDRALHGISRSGLPVLGAASAMDLSPSARVVVCLGSPRRYDLRATVVARLGLAADRYATVVHPSASIGTGCRIGAGSVLLAQAVLTTDVLLGAHVAVMPQVVLTHDDVLDDFATLASGVALGGSVHVGAGAYLGAGSVVREGVRIGANSLVGAGSVVLRDIPPGEVWVGNPARFLRSAPTAGVMAGGV